jgi:nitrite reductase (NADH) small subunit
MSQFQYVCSVDALVANSGVAALVNGQQIALFYLDNTVYATSNYDPICHAFVMSRGMIGDLKGQLMVASPLHKEHYNLLTGQCFEHPELYLPVYLVQIKDQAVWVAVP